MMKRHLTLILWLTALLCHSVGQSTISLDSTSLLIGDQTTLHISDAPTYPSLDDLNQNGIVAIKQWFDTASTTQHTLLTCFDAGDHWLHIGDDSLLLTVRDVAGVDTSKADIRDIAPVLEEPYTFWEIFRWVLLGVGIVAIVAAAIYVIRRLKAHKPIIELPKPPPVPADKKALKALEVLRQQQLWQQGKVKEYHTELTDIVRAYLEEAWHIPSTDMTSDQTLDAFVSASIPCAPQCCPALERMLRTADMVKFAKSEPLPNEHDRSMADATMLVATLAQAQAEQAIKEQERNSNAAHDGNKKQTSL